MLYGLVNVNGAFEAFIALKNAKQRSMQHINRGECPAFVLHVSWWHAARPSFDVSGRPLGMCHHRFHGESASLRSGSTAWVTLTGRLICELRICCCSQHSFKKRAALLLKRRRNPVLKQPGFITWFPSLLMVVGWALSSPPAPQPEHSLFTAAQCFDKEYARRCLAKTDKERWMRGDGRQITVVWLGCRQIDMHCHANAVVSAIFFLHNDWW